MRSRGIIGNVRILKEISFHDIHIDAVQRERSRDERKSEVFPMKDEDMKIQEHQVNRIFANLHISRMRYALNLRILMAMFVHKKQVSCNGHLAQVYFAFINDKQIRCLVTQWLNIPKAAATFSRQRTSRESTPWLTMDINIKRKVQRILTPANIYIERKHSQVDLRLIAHSAAGMNKDD